MLVCPNASGTPNKMKKSIGIKMTQQALKPLLQFLGME
jgi:hypothetical protein